MGGGHDPNSYSFLQGGGRVSGLIVRREAGVKSADMLNILVGLGAFQVSHGHIWPLSEPLPPLK